VRCQSSWRLGNKTNDLPNRKIKNIRDLDPRKVGYISTNRSRICSARPLVSSRPTPSWQMNPHTGISLVLRNYVTERPFALHCRSVGTRSDIQRTLTGAKFPVILAIVESVTEA